MQIGFAVRTESLTSFSGCWQLLVQACKELLSPGPTFVSDVNVLRPQYEGRCDDFLPVGLVQVVE